MDETQTRRLRRALAALCVALVAPSAASAINERLDRRIPYQGELSGATATVQMGVELFDEEEGGEPVWGPEEHEVTLDEAGRFVIVIGSSNLDQCVRAPFDRNLIRNPGNESMLVGGEIPEWTEVAATAWTTNNVPSPFQGDAFFFLSDTNAAGELAQDIDVSEFAPAIDAGVQSFAFSGWVNAFSSGNDPAQIIVEYLDQDSAVLDAFDSGTISPAGQVWTEVSDTRLAPSGARQVRVRLVCTRLAGSACNGYFDALSLVSVREGTSDLVCGSGGDGIPDLDQIDPSPLYVSISVDDGNDVTTLSPRQQLFPAYHASSATAGVAVGTVLMWWGRLEEVPPGFELCDGEPPATPGATLVGNKPDLRGRFPRGARAGVTDVQTVPATGGFDTAPAVASGGTAVTKAQLPNYSLPETLGTGFSGSHQHSNSHSCANDDGGDSDTHYALGDSSSRRNCQLIIGLSGNHTHSVTGSVRLGGSGQAHAHTVLSHDNRPSFLELFFIVRVK